MKKVIIGIIIFLSIFLVIFSIPYLLNEVAIHNYDEGKYNHKLMETLKSINFREKYVVYYNEGNMFNQEKKYDEALNSYEEALTKHPPIKKKCDIRINMTLTMIQMINTNNKQEIIEKLEKAKENLYNDNCASEEDSNGESQEAEQLEQEINEEIEELQKQMEQPQQETEEEESNSNKNNEEAEEELQIQNQIEEINREANQSRQRDLQEYENLGKYKYYSGKNW